MSCTKSVLAIAVWALCLSVAADDTRQSSSETTRPETSQQVDVVKYLPTQILCIKQTRTGSRIKETKCQTLADWQRDINDRNMRRSLIRARGKAASWETSP